MIDEPPEPLPPEAEDALRDSIAEFGVLVPVVFDGDATPVEGRHRARIAGELRVGYMRRAVAAETEEERTKLRKRLNDRNHLDNAQRRQMVVYLDGLGHSGRAIARALRMSKHSIRRDLAQSRDHAPAPTLAPSPPPQSRPASPSSAQAARFVSGLAEVVSTCAALSAHEDLSTVLTPQEARQWQPSISRALSGLRALQNQMKEYAK